MEVFFSTTRPLADSFIELQCQFMDLSVPFNVIYFKASHWPSGHMISSRPLIGEASFTTKLSPSAPPPYPPTPLWANLGSHPMPTSCIKMAPS